MTTTQTQTQGRTASKDQPDTPWLWNVVLLNDDDHSPEYVVRMMLDLFGHPQEKGLLIAKVVDSQERAVCMTTHKELAELKQEQIHSYGRDSTISECQGSMSAVIEPAEFEGDEGDGGGTS